MGIDIFHGYEFGTAKPSGFVPVAISRWPAARQPGPNLTRLGIWDLQDRPPGCSLLRLISKLLPEPEPVTELGPLW
jgi:hypothetical protein